MWLFIYRSTFGILRVIRVYFYQLFFWSPCIKAALIINNKWGYKNGTFYQQLGEHAATHSFFSLKLNMLLFMSLFFISRIAAATSAAHLFIYLLCVTTLHSGLDTWARRCSMILLLPPAQHIYLFIRYVPQHRIVDWTRGRDVVAWFSREVGLLSCCTDRIEFHKIPLWARALRSTC